MRIDAVELGHWFDAAQPLFLNLGFTIAQGSIVAIAGPSGSGKSTLLGILAGWTKPATGNVLTEGISSRQWVFQNPHGVAGRSALDHVALPYLARGYSRRQAETFALEVLDTVHLKGVATRPFKELSGGEAQRLMMARAIGAEPDLLLMDEPTAQLDLFSAEAVIDVLQGLADEGRIVVIATHDPRVRDRCDETISLSAIA